MFGILALAQDFLLTLSDSIAPLLGTGSVAGAVVLFTVCVRLLLLPLGYAQARAEVARVRLAPASRALREKHKDDPMRMARELSALHKEAGTSMFAGIGPALAGAPFLFVTYRLFSTDRDLLEHTLFGAPLGLHPLSGLFGEHALVLCALIALLSAVAWVQRRRTLAEPEAPSWIALLPFGTVVAALFVPLAAGVYLLTSTTWTTVERPALRRLVLLRDQRVVPGH